MNVIVPELPKASLELMGEVTDTEGESCVPKKMSIIDEWISLWLKAIAYLIMNADYIKATCDYKWLLIHGRSPLRYCSNSTHSGNWYLWHRRI